jgi:hypothetical protein
MLLLLSISGRQGDGKIVVIRELARRTRSGLDLDLFRELVKGSNVAFDAAIDIIWESGGLGGTTQTEQQQGGKGIPN